MSLVGLIFLIVVPFFTTAGIFHAEKYHALIGEVEEVDFNTLLDPIDIDRIRLVDQKMAQRLGDKKIGQDPALGSIVEIGSYSIQKYRENLYWVAPLLHRSYFKWANNRQGSPGYIMVSATNPQDVRLVQNIEGPVTIKYQPAAYFGDNLKRHIYFNGYMGAGFTDFTFEIDEDGRPFWVVTRYRKAVGYGGKEAAAALLVDAQTGEILEYSLDDTPAWVDRIQPEPFIVDQVNDWGKYGKGWFNAVFAEEGVLKLTPGISLVYGKGGRSYWYSGLTSAGSDDSTVGFILADTRTKEIRFYKQSGATELAAMGSAEGKVQEKGYDSTFPIMYNVFGYPTYISSLKDKAGLIKMVALVSVEDYSVLGIGETTQDALRSYKSALNRSVSLDGMESSLVVERVSGIVERIRSDVQSGNTFYYLMLEENDKVFVATSRLSEYLVLTEEEDQVEILYDEAESPMVDMSGFLNLSLE